MCLSHVNRPGGRCVVPYVLFGGLGSSNISTTTSHLAWPFSKPYGVWLYGVSSSVCTGAELNETEILE